MFKNVGANWVLTLVTIAVTYVLLPYSLHKLGEAQYGTWVLISSVTSYLGLLVLGVPMASVRYVALHAKSGRDEELNSAVASCAGLYLGMGVAVLVVGAVLLFAFDRFYEIAPALRSVARIAFAIVVLNTAVGFIAQLPFGIMAAFDDFVVRNKVLVGSLLMRLALTLILLKLNASLLMLAIVLSSCLAFEFTLGLVILHRRYPMLRVQARHFSWRTSKEIFSFSLFVLVLSVGAQLSFSTDAIVIGKVIGVSAIPYFTTGSMLAIYLMEFVIAIAAVVAPAASRLQAQHKLAELRDVFLQWSKICLSLTMMAALFLIVFGPRFIGWWVGDAFAGPSGTVLRILMVGNLIFLPVRGVALPTLMGLGKPRLPAFGFLGAGILNLGMSVVLAKRYGIAGVAIGTAVPNALFAIGVLVLACRELDLPLADYVRYVVPRAAIGAAPVLALLLVLERSFDIRGFGGLFAAGLAMVGVFAVVWIFFVYRGDRYVDLRGQLAAQLARARA
jgi:O-antigen/teichoic acid export membrane protein